MQQGFIGMFKSRLRNPTQHRDGFTIVELLVVIGIMAVLIAVSIPAFQGITRGSGMQTAVSEIRSTLSLARQWAIAKREVTYVVFLDSDNLFSNLALRAYNVFTEEKGYLSEWKVLPPGVYFDDEFRETKNVINNDVGGKQLTWIDDVIWYDNPNTTIGMWAIPFGPSGATELVGGAQNIEVYLTEGLFDESSRDFTPLDTAIRFGVDVNPFTGNVKVEENPPASG